MSLFDFRIKNGILVKYSGKDENVVIPSKVHTIEKSAFENNNRIKSVVIPNGVTTIDSKAFKMAKNLERIVLPYGLKVIKDQAFMCCYALKEV